MSAEHIKEAIHQKNVYIEKQLKRIEPYIAHSSAAQAIYERGKLLMLSLEAVSESLGDNGHQHPKVAELLKDAHESVEVIDKAVLALEKKAS